MLCFPRNFNTPISQEDLLVILTLDMKTAALHVYAALNIFFTLERPNVLLSPYRV